MNYQLMGYNFTTIQFVIAAVVIVALILVAVGLYIQRRRERTLAFRDINPTAPTHVLVITKDLGGKTNFRLQLGFGFSSITARWAPSC